MYALLIWALKPRLSYTSCKKGRAGEAVGGKIGRKKGRRSKRGSTGVFNIAATFI